MKTIEQHNADKMVARNSGFTLEQIKTNVRCPKCKDQVELFKVNPNILLMSDPPQVEVYCPWCGYRTSIIA